MTSKLYELAEKLADQQAPFHCSSWINIFFNSYGGGECVDSEGVEMFEFESETDLIEKLENEIKKNALRK